MQRERLWKRLFGTAGLIVWQTNVLMELAYCKARSNAELSRIHSPTSQTMTAILASLERRGLIFANDQARWWQRDARGADGGRTFECTDCASSKRNVGDRLLSPLSRDDVSRIRRLLEGCLAALGKNISGANAF